MQINILTLFPGMFEGVFSHSIISRALKQGKIDLNIVDLRSFSSDSHKTVDDRPYGGGPGMIIRVDIVDKALNSIKTQGETWTIILDPKGQRYTQSKARELSIKKSLTIICGHYEGVDHRVHENMVDEVVSVGDFVISGGEMGAMIIVDSVGRLLPGVLGNNESLNSESFDIENSVEYPQYTRPAEYLGLKVPEVLLGGNHKDIQKWREEKKRT